MERRSLTLSIILLIVVGIDLSLWLWFWPGFLIHKKSLNNNTAINLGNVTSTVPTPTSASNVPVITTPTSTLPSGTTPAATTVNTTTTTKTTTPKKTTTPTTPMLSYAEAVSLYANKRIQFDANCTAIPNSTIFKKGTKIMLDNRFGQARSVYLDGQRYSLVAYGFQIVTLTTTASLPHTMRVDCGTGKNNGQIIIAQ
jgi:hypothetical protein